MDFHNCRKSRFLGFKEANMYNSFNNGKWVYSTCNNRQSGRIVEKFIVNYNVATTTRAIYFLYYGKDILLETWICSTINDNMLLILFILGQMRS